MSDTLFFRYMIAYIICLENARSLTLSKHSLFCLGIIVCWLFFGGVSASSLLYWTVNWCSLCLVCWILSLLMLLVVLFSSVAIVVGSLRVLVRLAIACSSVWSMQITSFKHLYRWLFADVATLTSWTATEIASGIDLSLLKTWSCCCIWIWTSISMIFSGS